jgi:hypothetical protein
LKLTINNEPLSIQLKPNVDLIHSNLKLQIDGKAQELENHFSGASYDGIIFSVDGSVNRGWGRFTFHAPLESVDPVFEGVVHLDGELVELVRRDHVVKMTKIPIEDPESEIVAMPQHMINSNMECEATGTRAEFQAQQPSDTTPYHRDRRSTGPCRSTRIVLPLVRDHSILLCL